MSTTSSTPAAATLAEAPVERWAMSHAASHLRLWLTVVFGLVADLWTKDWAFRELAPHESRVLIENLASLQLSLNPGALFGLGAGLAPIFVGASVLALLFVLYLFANSSASRWSMHIALGLVLAGAMGNLYDRTTQSAYVVYYRDGSRVIGTLVEEGPQAITLGDFPNGNNPRVYRLPDDPRTGPQPVVRDFIKIEAKLGNLALWPWIFNIADAWLVVGVAVLLLNFWFDGKHSHERASPKSDPA